MEPGWTETTAAGMAIEIVEGDITEQRVDAIVNAANSSLMGGGGVDGAIHRKGGPDILAECRALRAARFGGGLPTGEAVATGAGKLPAKWVVHTVGPVYHGPAEADTELLRGCFRNSLRIAGELGAGSIAFPLISAGSYGWPEPDAVRQALFVLRQARLARVRLSRLVLFGTSTYETALAVAKRSEDDQ
jgi:O-acetyl-ADP-ribose deacetylase (regulator of RNase III)